MLSFFEAAGFSMWPFIRAGEKLIVSRVPIEDLRPGDIVLYQGKDQLICHRLVSKVEGGRMLRVRGDNTSALTELISIDAYRGKALGIIRKGGIIDLTGLGRRFVNRAMALYAPLFNKVFRAIRPIWKWIRNG